FFSEMQNLEASSELQSRLSSLSVSSFPGITSKSCEHNAQERLRSTDLSHNPDSTSQPDRDGTQDKGTEQAKETHPLSKASGQDSNRGSEGIHSGSNEAASTDGKAQAPPLIPPSNWTSPAVRELKAKLRQEKDCVVTVYRGDIMTVHVPTIPEGKRVCWEFATDNYDIGFGIYFDRTPVTSRAITVQISESSDDEDDEDELEGSIVPGDVEKGTKSSPNSHLGEILPVYRQDSHLAVQGGSHEYPGEGTYLFKFDNSYSLWRNKTLYYRIYYSI
uniref:Zgc:163014 n=1 Tax=Lepisosteus oculatus TaxID=7918 RepID=W5MXY0_LEPOC